MAKKSLHIIHLYPKEMNIYGDTGNVLILRKRLEWRGIEAQISLVGVGQKIPADADIVVGGGGQDAGQDKIQDDLQEKAASIHKLADNGVVMLMVCGMYQLFGQSFTTQEGAVIRGIGVLPLETVGGKERHIGNTRYGTDFGELAGYENHSGMTTIDDKSLSLGTPLLGAGNNGSDRTEGCVVKNVFGTYSHGPLLSKNPRFADELLGRALERKYPGAQLTPLNDELEMKAYEFAVKRPR